MRAFRPWGAILLALVAGAATSATRAAPSAPAAACPASLVHYGREPTATASLRDLPWIVARTPSARIVGYLSYYGGAILSDGRVNESDGAVLYAGGPPARIVWAASGHPGRTLVLWARRLDGAGRFTLRVARTRVDGRAAFAESLSVPSAGCWRLDLRDGKLHASAVLAAVAPPVAAACDPTPLHPPSGHPGGLPELPWVAARPSAAGITGSLFYPPPRPLGAGTSIYPGGRVPNGGTTKILWAAKRPGRALVITGRRLDGPGSFSQTEPGANGNQFPSIPDVPAAGCWLLTLRTGSTGAVVVVDAVDG